VLPPPIEEKFVIFSFWAKANCI
jgi:hypothetical protein